MDKILIGCIVGIVGIVGMAGWSLLDQWRYDQDPIYQVCRSYGASDAVCRLAGDASAAEARGEKRPPFKPFGSFDDK